MHSSNPLNRRAFALAAGAFGMGLAGVGRAAAFPQQRVAMIVPFSAGTAVDVVARFLAAKLAQQWNQPVFVENRVGGDGVIGTKAVKAAPEDGHTILYTGPPFLFAPDINTAAGYDPLKDFKPVARVTAPVYMLAATMNAPYNTFQEFVAAARRSGARLDVGTVGMHSTATVSGMAKAAGAEINIVNYKTTAQLISDGIAGHVPLVLSALGSLAQLTRDGKLKALATSGPKRSVVTPEVPTAMEGGATGFSVVSWNGAFVRTGTPDATVAAIAGAIRKATSEPDFLAFCKVQGLEPAFEDGKIWAQDLLSEKTSLSELLRQSGAWGNK